MSASELYPSDAKMPQEEITTATRHLFLCVGPDCCDSAVGEALWSVLKTETRKLSVLENRVSLGGFGRPKFAAMLDIAIIVGNLIESLVGYAITAKRVQKYGFIPVYFFRIGMSACRSRMNPTESFAKDFGGHFQS